MRSDWMISAPAALNTTPIGIPAKGSEFDTGRCCRPATGSPGMPHRCNSRQSNVG